MFNLVGYKNMKTTKKNFSIDAKVLLSLGRDSIKDHTTALLELVKNSYDADATRVEIEIFCKSDKKYIRIADNGSGMTEQDIDKKWLRIGYSSKREDRITALKRRRTGEKGIGRISADRLGATLELRTKSENTDVIGLQVDWNSFDVEGKSLFDIDVIFFEKPTIEIPGNENPDEKSSSGTELIIKSLRQFWSSEDLGVLFEELAIFVSPFKETRNFEIFLTTDIDSQFNGKITTVFEQAADAELSAYYQGDKVVYSIRSAEEILKKKKAIEEEISVKGLMQKVHPAKDLAESALPNHLKCGPVEIKIMFYLRQSKDLAERGLNLKTLRHFLDRHAGIKIYRDNIYVKPYGNPNDPEGDWLGISERQTRDPAGVGRESYKMKASQIVGAVFVGRDKNPQLIDSSAREGLIKGPAFYDLKGLVLGCLNLLETYRHEQTSREKTEKKESAPLQKIKSLNKELSILKEGLEKIEKQIPEPSQKPIKDALEQVSKASKNLEKTQETVDELVSETRIYRGLATIGIAAAVFGHETQSSISGVVGAVITSREILESKAPNLNKAKAELVKAEKYANQVAAWGAFALARVQRDKRRLRLINIKDVIEDVVGYIKPVFEAIEIELKTKIDDIEGRTFEMDIEAVLLNFLTNAYTACQQEDRPRKVRLETHSKKSNNQEGFEIIVADSGPGVAKKFMARIWEPLFSTKMDKSGKQIGTGLGLSIVESIIDELDGEKTIESDSELKGAKFKIWLPLKK